MNEARTRYRLVGVITCRNDFDWGVPDDCEIEVSVAERLAVYGRNMEPIVGNSNETIGKR